LPFEPKVDGMDGSRRARSDRRWNEDLADSDDPVVGATALLVLGAGLGSLFGLPVLSAIDFWVIFVIGYAVVVPLVSLLRGRNAKTEPGHRESESPRQSETAAAGRTDEVDEPLSRLRDRYARGDLSEEQFERKLETLLETETPEDARERIRRERENVEGERSDGIAVDEEAGDDGTAREFERST
jgi:uncharacterized membrane protein